MIICRKTRAAKKEIEKFNKSFYHEASVAAGKLCFGLNCESPPLQALTRCDDDKYDDDNNFHYSSHAKEEFLIQFVKKDGKRRHAELCVRQWKHKDD